MWVVYILQSIKDHKYYIGSTNNFERRMREHNLGYCRSTRNRRPLIAIYTEPTQNRKQAREKELKIKSYKGGRAFKNLISKN